MPLRGRIASANVRAHQLGVGMKTVHLAAIALAAMSAASCASRPEGEDQARDQQGGFLNAAATPLRDVGLIRPDVPDLIENLTYPYEMQGLAEGCPAVLYEIGRLDAILGDENYQPSAERGMYARAGNAAGDYAVDSVADAAADLVPYRSWVRRLSGASGRDRKAAAAYALGEQRRTFLRGFGAALGCPWIIPNPPPPPRPDDDDDDD